MSDHTWVQEHAAAYIAGGLDADEAARLEAHARDCAECASVLTGARRLDSGLGALFADINPDFGLEDRAVNRLRTPPTRRLPVLHRPARWAVAAAVVLALAAIGAVAGSLTSRDGTRLAGFSRKSIFMESPPTSALQPEEKYLPDEDPGLDAKIEAALPEIDRLDKATRDAKVRGDNIGQPTAPNLDTTALAPPGLGPGEKYNDFFVPGDLDRIKEKYGKNGIHWAEMPRVELEELAGRSKSEVVQVMLPVKGMVVADAVVELNKLLTPVGKVVALDKANTVLIQDTVGNIERITKTLEPIGEGTVERPPMQKTITTKPNPLVEPTPTGYTKELRPDSKNPPPPPDPNPAPDPSRRVIIRSGDIEFEVESFDAASATITKLVLGIKGGFIATTNSDKLPNGKVKGSITVRVPPEQLDGLVLDLRRELGKGGELKGVRLSSQDVTKMYTDLESRLRAARTMETRLLQIIKEGKGEIKQLLDAEKELGVWRTKIEEYEGELRYYASLAALSTLTITLTEKEIRAAAAITEREQVQAGVEVDDVDKAYQQMIAAVGEVKGRITKSELKQLSAGQFNATLVFEVAAESGGPIRDRLRMLGRIARLEIDRTTQTEGGTLPSTAKATRGDTMFKVQLYNLANVAPRETATLQVAVTDVSNAYQSLRDIVARSAGRVLVAQLNEQDRQNISAQLDFDVRRSDEGAIRTALDAAGDVISRQVVRTAESDSVTDSKVLYKVTLVSASRLKPREVFTVSVEVGDVGASATVFAAQVAEAKGRQVDAKFDHDARGRATAKLVFEVPLAAASGLVDRLRAEGTVRVSQTRDQQAPEGRYATAQIHVTLTNAEAIVADGNGLWPQVHRGLSISASWLLTSVMWVVVGLCVVLPWAVIGLGGYRLVRRFVQRAPSAP